MIREPTEPDSDELKEIIARAEERLADLPEGAIIDFEEILFGKEVQ